MDDELSIYEVFGQSHTGKLLDGRAKFQESSTVSSEKDAQDAEVIKLPFAELHPIDENSEGTLFDEDGCVIVNEERAWNAVAPEIEAGIQRLRASMPHPSEQLNREAQTKEGIKE